MIQVSEKPIFGDYYNLIPIGSEVSIIQACYVRFNTRTFKEEVLESDEVHFKVGTLISSEDQMYRVRLHQNYEEIVTFVESPRNYYFRKK